MIFLRIKNLVFFKFSFVYEVLAYWKANLFLLKVLKRQNLSPRIDSKTMFLKFENCDLAIKEVFH
jgi:hypothetical protein